MGLAYSRLEASFVGVGGGKRTEAGTSQKWHLVSFTYGKGIHSKNIIP